MKTFEQILDEMQKKEVDIMVTKGKEYTIGSADRFHNFKTVAKFMGLTPKQALGVYLYKHMASIFNYIKDEKEYSDEGIMSRIQDARNYLILLAGLIEDEKTQDIEESSQ